MASEPEPGVEPEPEAIYLGASAREQMLRFEDERILELLRKAVLDRELHACALVKPVILNNHGVPYGLVQATECAVVGA